MARLLRSLGSWCARHGLVVIAIWALLGIGVGAAVTTFGAQTNNDLSLPGTDSQAVKDLLESTLPAAAERRQPDRLRRRRRASSPTSDNKQAIYQSVKAIRAGCRTSYSVTDPFSSDGQTAGLLSEDEQTAFAPVLLDIGSGDLDEEMRPGGPRRHRAAPPSAGHRRWRPAARSARDAVRPTTPRAARSSGILAAMIILSLVLGSLVAMGMPIISAVVGLVVALAGRRAASGTSSPCPSSAPTLATMIGLGVGIDYALFLITRHQDQLARRRSRCASRSPSAVATSGSAIVFAGCTVVIALLSLGRRRHPAGDLARARLRDRRPRPPCSSPSRCCPAFLGLVGRRITLAGAAGVPAPASRGRRAGLWARWGRVVAPAPAGRDRRLSLVAAGRR